MIVKIVKERSVRDVFMFCSKSLNKEHCGDPTFYVETRRASETDYVLVSDYHRIVTLCSLDVSLTAGSFCVCIQL